MSLWRFEVPAPVFFGEDARLQVLGVLRRHGFQRLGVVVDGALASQGAVRDYLDRSLPDAGFGMAYVLPARSDREPDYDYLDESADAFREARLDCLFGIGGGSTMDLAKGIAILLRNPGRGIDYRGMNRVGAPGVPTVLFPTTAGTGSEVTGTAAFTDLRENLKLGINGRFVAAWAGVLDPVLTLGCPREPTMASGMDALVHSVESFTAHTSTALAREMARAAFGKLVTHLARVIDQPDDVHAREEMLLGSHLAGIALWNAGGGGPASAISYPLGVRHRVPHGFAGGLILPGVVRYNVEHGYDGYAALYDTIAAREGRTSRDASHAFAAALDALYEQIRAPGGFGRWGVTPADVPALIEDTMTTRAANLSHNPVPFGRREVEALLDQLTAGSPLRSMAAAAGPTAGLRA